jgi:hypothetical protein
MRISKFFLGFQVGNRTCYVKKNNHEKEGRGNKKSYLRFPAGLQYKNPQLRKLGPFSWYPPSAAELLLFCIALFFPKIEPWQTG